MGLLYFKKIKTSYRHTILACYLGYITQAIVNMLPPLLFLIFQDEFSVTLPQITSLVTINFCVQITVDLIAGKISDRTGYRPLAVLSHVTAILGLTGLAWLPDLMPDPYWGLVLCIVLNAIGGGLDEVLISPIVEACPDDGNKETAMALLHSFYCWGVVGVVALTTLFLGVFGKASWRIVCLLWAIIPLADALYFCLVPIRELNENGDGMGYGELAGNGMFWLLAVLMVAAGASEQAMSQWASVFAESGLGVSKAMGDILGPCLFAVLMGTARVVYAKYAPGMDSLKSIMICSVLCILGYLTSALAPSPLLSLFGCALCGFSVGIFWPGLFSIAPVKLPRGGTALFALLALAGDIGCTSGPTLVGFVASAHGDDLRIGLLCAIIFPLTLLCACAYMKKMKMAE